MFVCVKLSSLFSKFGTSSLFARDLIYSRGNGGGLIYRMFLIRFSGWVGGIMGRRLSRSGVGKVLLGVGRWGPREVGEMGG